MRFVLLSLMLFMLTPAVCRAADNPGQPTAAAAADQQQAVKAVADYLGSISTLRASFVQTANDGKQATGTFYLSRPGRMRIDYDPPVTDFIVADGILIYYYDGQMKQQTSTVISKSLADFFLRKNLTLSGDISVSDIKRGNNLLQMTLVQTRNPLAGSLTLILSENPLQLREWKIVDAQGLVTDVKLQKIDTGIPLNSSLFHYYDPARSSHLYNGN